MFQMEAESLSESSSAGGDFGVIGAIAGAAVGAYAGGAQGAQMGAQVGQALGQSIGFNVGSASGSASSSQNGNRAAEASAAQSASSNTQNTVNMVAVLEANLNLYEITLDELKPDDMSASFFADFMQLPTSYYQVGAASAFQEFILRYGTHFIKSAKFGGELKVIKTSKKESTMNEEQFAETAESEMAGMMSTLKSSFKQEESGFSLLGLGSKQRSSSQTASQEGSSSSGRSASQASESNREAARSEFVKTTVLVQGGEPSVAAAITDFYTPRFRETFLKWLNSITEYARPYVFTLGKISEALNFSPQSLFKSMSAKSGCFGPNVKKDSKTGDQYYLRLIKSRDALNNTVELSERVKCKYGTSKETFMESLKAMRLALERAENIYMTEGPMSASNFDIAGGEPGCTQRSLKYVMDDDKLMKTWPTWERMQKTQFKVLFDMQQDLPTIPRKAEFIVKYYDGRWWTRRPQGSYSMAGACRSPQDEAKRSICIAGVPFRYSELDGFINLDLNTYTKYKVVVPFWLRRSLAKVEELKLIVNEGKERGTIGLVPCNPKWSNRQQISISNNSSCMYFQAASAGSLFVIFAGLPSNFQTWYYIRISRNGVSFYQAMKIMKVDNQIKIGSLGSEKLYEPYFICIKKQGQNLFVEYGKSVKDSELGLVYSSYEYRDAAMFSSMFFAFATGESKVSISDLRVVKEEPQRACMNGLVSINGRCALECDPQCDGCYQSKDPKSCERCKGFTFRTKRNSFTCVASCPAGAIAEGRECKCNKGHRVSTVDDKISCVKCQPGSISKGDICEECPSNTFSSADLSKCIPCPRGRTSDYGSSKCGETIFIVCPFLFTS